MQLKIVQTVQWVFVTYSQTNIFVALGDFFIKIQKSHSYPSSTDISYAKALIV